MDFGNMGENLPILLVVIGLILLQFFLRRGRVPAQYGKAPLPLSALAVGDGHGNIGPTVLALVVGNPVGLLNNIRNSRDFPLLRWWFLPFQYLSGPPNQHHQKRQRQASTRDMPYH